MGRPSPLRRALAGPAAVAAVAVAAALTAAALTTVSAQGTTTTMTLDRGERTISVFLRAAAADGARFILASPHCEPQVRTSTFFGPDPGFVETLFDDTRVTSTIALVRAPEDGEETLELFGGAATFDRPGCLEAVDEAAAVPVVLEQGRTLVHGRRFSLDQGTDLATMEGPIELTRADADGIAALEARADGLTFDVVGEHATLVGGVEVRSAGRVTTADRLELDERAGVAILTGAPAVSRRDGEEVRGATLRYDLETDDVVVIGGVQATFTIELD